MRADPKYAKKTVKSSVFVQIFDTHSLEMIHLFSMKICGFHYIYFLYFLFNYIIQK